MNWFETDQISPTGFYAFRWLATRQPAENTPNGQPKNWTISRDRLNAARRRGRLVVCPNNPTLVRGDHLLAWLKGKTCTTSKSSITDRSEVMKQNLENTAVAIMVTLVLVIFIAPVLDGIMQAIAEAIAR